MSRKVGLILLAILLISGTLAGVAFYFGYIATAISLALIALIPLCALSAVGLVQIADIFVAVPRR